MTGDLIPIEILSGVEPSTDRPSSSTRHYVFSDKIRFKDGFPEKIGGWESFQFSNGNAIDGTPRSIFSYVLNGIVRYQTGTNTRLYDIFGSALTNITPVQTSTVAIADSLDSNYGTLANDPATTVSGSTTVTIADATTKVRAGDTITLSGFSGALNGIPDTELNTQHFVRSQDANSFTIIVATPATSSGSGGGASVVLATGIVTVNATAHGMGNGDRTKIAGATNFAGFTAATEINLEHIIRNVSTNAFDISTTGMATSSVSGGGGASTTYQKPIASGAADTLVGSGYGVGLYGTGLYGVSKTSSSTTLPRLWSHDRFGDLIISCPGNGGYIYSWDGDTQEAPAKVANSPVANYAFVSDSILVALGYDTSQSQSNENGISWSDQGGLTNWTTGQSGGDTIEGAGRFITHASARGENLLFTLNQTYLFRYIGGQFIWQIRQLDADIGCIAQNARTSASGVIYWMGLNNFYMWRGGSVEVVPSNSGAESTIREYVFGNLNRSQKEKVFCWYNPLFREIWWHYPSSNSNDPDRIARYNIDTREWTPDTLERTASEYPSILTQNPYLINLTGTIYLHENGTDDDGAAMDWQLTTNLIYGGTDTVQHKAFVPDYTLTDDMSVTITTRDYPKSSNKSSQTYTIDSTTDRVATEQNGRFWQYDMSGSAIGQSVQFGQWYQELQKSSKK